MNKNIIKVGLSAVVTSILLSGCVGSTPDFGFGGIYKQGNTVSMNSNEVMSEMNKDENAKRNFEDLKADVNKNVRDNKFQNISEENKDAVKTMAKVSSTPPNIIEMKKYVTNNSDEKYYYELLKNYVHSFDKIETKTIKTKVSNEDVNEEKIKAMMKFGMSRSQAKQNLSSQGTANIGNSVNETKVLKYMPQGSYMSIVSDSGNTKTTMNAPAPMLGWFGIAKFKSANTVASEPTIRIVYKMNNERDAYNKLWSLSNKFEHFISHNENWGIKNQKNIRALQRHTISNKDAQESYKKGVSEFNEKIKEAEENGKSEFEIKILKDGLANFQGNMNQDVLKKNIMESSFTYQWSTPEKSYGVKMLTVDLKATKSFINGKETNVVQIEFKQTSI